MENSGEAQVSATSAEGLRALVREKLKTNKSSESAPAVVEPAVTAPSEPVTGVEPQVEEPKGGAFGLGDIDKKAEALVKKEAPAVESDSEPQYKGTDEGKKNDWKKITESAKVAKREAEEAKVKLGDLESRVQLAESALAEARKKLEGYEGLESAVVFENSPEFQALASKKVALKDKGRQVSEMNDVSPELLNEAMAKGNYREAVMYLNDHVADVSVFSDLKAVVQEFFMLESEEQKALKSPDEYREIVKQKVKAEMLEKAKQQKALALSKISDSYAALDSLKTEGNSGLFAAARQDVVTLVGGLIDSGVELDAGLIDTFSKVWTRAYLYSEQSSLIEKQKAEIATLKERIGLSHGTGVNTSTSTPSSEGKFDKGQLLGSLMGKIRPA